jgi:hypothetical protein
MSAVLGLPMVGRTQSRSWQVSGYPLSASGRRRQRSGYRPSTQLWSI